MCAECSLFARDTIKDRLDYSATTCKYQTVATQPSLPVSPLWQSRGTLPLFLCPEHSLSTPTDPSLPSSTTGGPETSTLCPVNSLLLLYRIPDTYTCAHSRTCLSASLHAQPRGSTKPPSTLTGSAPFQPPTFKLSILLRLSLTSSGGLSDR